MELLRRPFEQHLYSAGNSDVHADELVAQAQDILRARHAEPLRMPELARSLGLSLRTLNRRFNLATGISPGTYLLQQRINSARIQAKREEREIRDGEVLTACQAVCPTDSIVFGNINDPASRVSQLKASPRNYSTLAELNTRPRTTYLAAVRNPHPSLPSHASVGGHQDTHDPASGRATRHLTKIKRCWFIPTLRGPPGLRNRSRHTANVGAPASFFELRRGRLEPQ